MKVISDKRARKKIDKGCGKAEIILKDVDKTDKFLRKLEKKLKVVPKVGDKLAYAPIMASLVRNYVNKSYKDIPVGVIIAVVSSLIYFVSPIDISPDTLPMIGYLDDATVLAVCWKLVDSDIKKFLKWRDGK